MLAPPNEEDDKKRDRSKSKSKSPDTRISLSNSPLRFSQNKKNDILNR